MEKYYHFAGIDFVVSIPDERMYAEERYLERFRADSVFDPHYFRYSVVESLEPPRSECLAVTPDFRAYQEGNCAIRYIGSVRHSWEPAYARAVHCGKDHVIQLRASQYPNTVSAKTVLNCLATEHLAVENCGVVFHCSYIERNGKAIVFTAPSGTGKSTQADLWHDLRGSEIINGDRAIIRATDDGILACGIPFAGSSVHCLNRTLPLEAIVYLAQAPATTVHKLHGYAAFARLWEGCSVNTWDPADMAKASDTVAKIANAVPVFYLACTPDESAVTALEQALKGREIL